MGEKTLHSVELSSRFDSASFEDRIYNTWQQHGYFGPRKENKNKPFVVVIPPPNVTGVLHLGHALNNCLQDILIRYHRMSGKQVLWVPGTDHAGIATQAVVERELLKEGMHRNDLGREEFLKRTENFALQHKKIIIHQLQKIGSSCDWERERFTLDKGLSRAVRHVFVRLYKKGLIYKGNYLINWSVANQTALSDDEVIYKKVQGKLYHIRYELVEMTGFLEIATTRPETIFADVALAVHPEDPRYQSYHGLHVHVPLIDRTIPIISDGAVDKEFGTGILKITPGHSMADYEIAQRHTLPLINILHVSGHLNDHVPEAYRDLSVNDARKKITEELMALDLMVKSEDIIHQVGHGERSDDVIEPLLSEQWFVKMRPLAKKAIQALREQKIRFYPRKWESTYLRWLENVRDWCISRQLWWGHRIPVWYDEGQNKIIVSEEDPTENPIYQDKKLHQDTDVLDTWFSSWLWPFSVFGWPDYTDDLARFYPTTTLVTGYDIIFFWVARMVMAGLEFTENVPFKDIYITNLIRDIKGRKMSKSLGNGIDPLYIVEKHGADALRFTLSFLSSQGTDLHLNEDTFSFGSKFVNKLWNASRYILQNLDNCTYIPMASCKLRVVDKWMMHRMHMATSDVIQAMQQYRFNDASYAVYDVFWNEFCDWYLEVSKVSLYGNVPTEKNRAVSLLLVFLERILRFLHPFLPFVTEEIFSKLPAARNSSHLIIADYPQLLDTERFPDDFARFEALKDLVRKVRSTRSELTVPRSKRIVVAITFDKNWQYEPFVKQHEEYIKELIYADTIHYAIPHANDDKVISIAGDGYRLHLFIRHIVDVRKHAERIQKQIVKFQQQYAVTQQKLSLQAFMQRAHPRVVQDMKDRKEELANKLRKNKELLDVLKA